MPLPAGRKALKSKWVFATKEKNDGSLRYKARLVIKGFMQVEGLDYQETFAPVIKMQSLRMILSIANHRKMLIHQMDVKTAFLNGYLEEDIYMEQPEGQVIPEKESLVCKLERSLYGLKQSPRCWNELLNTFLVVELKFRRFLGDTATYARGQGVKTVYIEVYVDDLLIMSQLMQEIQEVKDKLNKRFEMVDFGEVSTVLKIKVKFNRDKGELSLDQEKYANFLLQKFGMMNSKPVDTPMVTGLKFSKEMEANTAEEKQEMALVPYRSAVGSLMYLMTSTRHDLASAIGILSRFLNNPGRQHWEGVKRVFRYLKGTTNLGLKFVRAGGPQSEVQLEGYTDSDWGGCLDSRKSTGAYLFKLGGAAVSWASRRQTSVALSSCEAEYMAACMASKEAVWQRSFLEELGEPRTGPVEIKSDSESALNLMKNPVFHSKTKHIGIQYHFTRELVGKGDVSFVFCRTAFMVADSLTKAVPREKVEFCRDQMGLTRV